MSPLRYYYSPAPAPSPSRALTKRVAYLRIRVNKLEKRKKNMKEAALPVVAVIPLLLEFLMDHYFKQSCHTLGN